MTRQTTDHYAVVSIAIKPDPLTNKVYLNVAEGSSHALRLLDVTENSPNATKVTTMLNIDGPRFVTMGLTDNVIVGDRLGVVSDLELHPVIKCGNQWAFFNESLDNWFPSEDFGDQIVLGPVYTTYNLTRAAAFKGGKKVPMVRPL